MEKTVFDHSISLANGEALNLDKMKGKPILFVNIATRCGYTGQLDDIEKLYQKYKAKGFNVVGVPSNDFGSQTPEQGKDIVKFCRLKYGVSFPITKKVPVTGKSKHSLANYLVSISGGKEIGWNFEKFLFNGNGKFVSRFTSSENPVGGTLEKKVASLLN
jgi:glutathione peroxidase